MAKSISFISGKGGSGKTTLALSVASMFITCGFRVLLVDCDLATNGATYFYEGRMENPQTQLTSFYDILNKDNIEQNYLKISDQLHFVPSISNIQKYNEESTYLQSDISKMKSRFCDFYKKITDFYDFVIFDCQAGYAEELEVVITKSDFNLAVMEADAISSAAMRSLYLKLAHVFKDRKIFQAFNKLTAEEQEIYSKISGGTVFTNIEAVTFDWAIRKAFATSQIPNMRDTSIKFVEQIFNICKTIVNKLGDNQILLDKINIYEQKLELQKLYEKKEKIKDDLASRKTSKRTMLFTVNIIVTTITLIALIVGCVYATLMMEKESSTILTIVISCFTCLIATVQSFLLVRRQYNSYKDTLKLQRQLYNLEDKIHSKELKLLGKNNQ